MSFNRSRLSPKKSVELPFGLSPKGALTWFSSLAMIVGPLIYASINDNLLEYDQNSCPIGLKSPRHTVMLIDASDEIQGETLNGLRRTVNRIKAGMLRFEKLSIFSITNDHSALPRNILTVCNPGQRSDADKWVEPPAEVQRRFDDEFGPKLEQTIVEISTQGKATYSPIMESIKAVANTNGFTSDGIPKRLIIFSDMLQNMPQYSHFKVRNPTWQDLRATDPQYVLDMSVNFQNVAVEIYYLNRRKFQSYQNVRHQQFWQDYFRAMQTHALINTVDLGPIRPGEFAGIE